MKAGQAVSGGLGGEGVEYTFGVVGSTTNSIVTEMHGRSDIRFVDTRHEEGAAFMAYGYARASGKPTACITTSGPGTINLVTGIALAYKGRAPVIVIAGDVARDFIYRDGSQAFDLVGLFKPITKLALEVNKTERIPEMLHYAFRAALSDKQGPAFLDIPRDLLDDQTVAGEPLRPGAYRAVETRIAGDAQAIQRAAALLAQAQRPLLLAGGGIIAAGAPQERVAKRGGGPGGAPSGAAPGRAVPDGDPDDAAAGLPGAASCVAERLHGDDRRRCRAGTGLRPAELRNAAHAVQLRRAR